MTLKEWRLAKGWTQKRLAEAIQQATSREGRAIISDAHIRAWEGGVEPAWSIGQAITKVTGGKVTPASFIKQPAS